MTGRLRRLISRWPFDGYSTLLIAMVLLAAVLPVRGIAATGMSWVTQAAIVLLFFLHGARLSRSAVIAGATHWRLHLLVFAITFALFPLIGLVLWHVPPWLLAPQLATGFLFLTLLPSTVQSSIAFTAMARGNVSAAVCSAAASNLLGTFITPALVALTIGIQVHGGDTGAVVRSIMLQLLLPFVIGQLLQPKLGAWIVARRGLVSAVDRGSILLVVYTAFSAAVVEGLFHQVATRDLAMVALLSAALLALVMALSLGLSRLFGFARADEIVILFCGSKKSLASGVPMAGVLFPAAVVGTAILPLMVFHQIQLLVCAEIALRYGRGGEDPIAG